MNFGINTDEGKTNNSSWCLHERGWGGEAIYSGGYSIPNGSFNRTPENAILTCGLWKRLDVRNSNPVNHQSGKMTSNRKFWQFSFRILWGFLYPLPCVLTTGCSWSKTHTKTWYMRGMSDYPPAGLLFICFSKLMLLNPTPPTRYKTNTKQKEKKNRRKIAIFQCIQFMRGCVCFLLGIILYIFLYIKVYL